MTVDPSSSNPNFGAYQDDAEYSEYMYDEADIIKGKDGYEGDMEIEEYDTSSLDQEIHQAYMFKQILISLMGVAALVVIVVLIIKMRSTRNTDRSDIENLKHSREDEENSLILNTDNKVQVQ